MTINTIIKLLGDNPVRFVSQLTSKGDAPARFVSVIFILMGIGDGVKRGKGVA